MKKLLLLCSLFLLTQPLFATSIVVLIASDYIIIGTDSKRQIIDAEKNYTITETVCKIRLVNDYCFASAGLIASEATRYSSDQIIRQHLAKTTSIKKAVRAIEKELAKALQAELQFQQKHQPKQFIKTMESGNHLLEVAVVKMVNNQPQVYVIGFEVADKKTLRIKTYSKNCGASCVTDGPQLLFLGEYSGMEKYMEAPRVVGDPAHFINQLIVSQATITPRSVGAPVNMVKLNATGVEWLNQQCQ